MNCVICHQTWQDDLLIWEELYGDSALEGDFVSL